MRRLWGASILGLGLLLAPTALAASGNWQQGDGYVDVRDITPEEAKRKALNLARAKAMQKVLGIRVRKQFLGATTERSKGGEDFAFDELSTSLDGMILGERNLTWETSLIPGGPNEPKIQRVSVRGEFQVAEPPEQDASFRVDLKLSRSRLVAGDSLALTLSATAPVHAMVFCMAADDRIYMIYPNPYRQALTLEAGKRVTLPESTDGIELKPQTVPGHDEDVEVLRVIALRKPFAPPRLDANGSTSFTEFFRWMATLPPSQWGQADQVYTVHRAERD